MMEVWFHNFKSLSKGRSLLALVVIVFSSLLGLIVGKFGILAMSVVAIVAIFAFACTALQLSFLVLMILILSAFSLDYLQFILNLPNWFGWIPDLLVLILIALVAITKKRTGPPARFPRSTINACVLLFLIAFLSLWKNGTQFLVGVAGLKNYFLYPFLFFTVLHLDLSCEQQRFAKSLILGLALLQVPVALLQHLSILPGAANPHSGAEDLVSGTLGANATGILSVMCIMVIAVMLNLFVFDKFRAKYLVIILISILGPIVSEGKIAFFLLPVVLLSLLFLAVVRRPVEGRMLKILFVIVLVVLLLILIRILLPLYIQSNTSFEIFYSPEALLRYLTQTGGDFQFAKYGRLTDINETMRLITTGLSTFLIGFGPGELSSTARSISPAYSTFNWYFDKGIGSVQATAMLFEVGLLGTAANLALLITLISGSTRVIRNTKNQALLIEATSFLLIFTLFFLSLLYTQPWWSPALSVSFWILSAVHWTILQKNPFNNSVREQAKGIYNHQAKHTAR